MLSSSSLATSHHLRAASVACISTARMRVLSQRGSDILSTNGATRCRLISSSLGLSFESNKCRSVSSDKQVTCVHACGSHWTLSSLRNLKRNGTGHDEELGHSIAWRPAAVGQIAWYSRESREPRGSGTKCHQVASRFNCIRITSYAKRGSTNPANCICAVTLESYLQEALCWSKADGPSLGCTRCRQFHPCDGQYIPCPSKRAHPRPSASGAIDHRRCAGSLHPAWPVSICV